jgi:hypothetical protein
MNMKLPILAAMASAALFAQEESGTRGIVPEEVLKARPQAKAAGRPKPQYQPIGPQVLKSLRETSAAREVGVTVWRLRAASASDSGARILVQQESETVEWVPERVSSSSALKAGDRVRLSIESPEAGYLYVIDRERYASGEHGEPYLIFPTSRTREGDNRVSGGKLIDIPAQDDRPNFFTLRRSRPDQAEEQLTILLTQEPLPDVQIGPKAVRLSDEQVGRWEKQWGAGKTERFELSGGAGKTWTQAEQQAAASGGTRILTQEDPPPQTVYRVAAKPGEPLMVTVRLRYSAAK